MANVYSCPYCNAQFSLEVAVASPRGRCCPRCGEPLTEKLSPGAEAESANVAPDVSSQERTAGMRRLNRSIGLGILCVMGVMGLGGLIFALWTIDFRRSHDFKIPQAVPRVIEAPTEWSGLGYLPLDCNIVAGVNLAEIVESPQGKELLAQPRPPLIDSALSNLETWTGLKPADLDHVVGGIDLQSKMMLTLVVGTRRAFEPADLVKQLKAKPAGEHRGKPIYAFQPNPPTALGGLVGRAWFPNQQTLVLVVRLGDFEKNDLEAIPDRPRTGADAPPPPIRDVLSQLEKQSQAWVVGSGNFAGLSALAPKGNRPGPDWQALAGIKKFGLNVLLPPEPFVPEKVDKQENTILHAQLYARDEAAMDGLKQYLTAQADQHSLSVALPPTGTKGPDALKIIVERKVSMAELRGR